MAKTLTVTNPNLWRIAQAELGDSEQWLRIAQLNGVDEPVLNGTYKLVIPKPQSGDLSDVIDEIAPTPLALPGVVVTASTVAATVPSASLSGLTAAAIYAALGFVPARDAEASNGVSTPITLTLSSITGGLGYTPLDRALGNQPNGYLKLDGSGDGQIISLAVSNSLTVGGQRVATMADLAALPTSGGSGLTSLTLTGDVTGSVSSSTTMATTLATTGVAAGSYGVVTVDTKGRVTAGRALSSSDVTTALGFTPGGSYTLTSAAITQALTYTPAQPLGYTPANVAGDTFVGPVTLKVGSSNSNATLLTLASTDAGADKPIFQANRFTGTPQGDGWDTISFDTGANDLNGYVGGGISLDLTNSANNSSLRIKADLIFVANATVIDGPVYGQSPATGDSSNQLPTTSWVANAIAAAVSSTPGSPGRSITAAAINSSGHLILTFSDSTTVDAGNVLGTPGSAGAAGTSITAATVNGSGHLILTLSTGSTLDAGYVVGPVGSGGGGQGGLTFSNTPTAGHALAVGPSANTVTDAGGPPVVYDGSSNVTIPGGLKVGPSSLPTLGQLSVGTTANTISLALSDDVNSSLYVAHPPSTSIGGAIIGGDPGGGINLAFGPPSRANIMLSTTTTGVTVSGVLTAPQLAMMPTVAPGEPGGSDNGLGGRILFQRGSTDTRLGGPMAIDIYNGDLRIFEFGNQFRGVSLDLAAQPSLGNPNYLLTTGSNIAGNVYQPPSSSIVRSLGSKLNEIISLSDYGYVGGNVVADSDALGYAIQAFANRGYSSSIFIPPTASPGLWDGPTITSIMSNYAGIFYGDNAALDIFGSQGSTKINVTNFGSAQSWITFDPTNIHLSNILFNDPNGYVTWGKTAITMYGANEGGDSNPDGNTGDSVGRTRWNNLDFRNMKGEAIRIDGGHFYEITNTRTVNVGRPFHIVRGGVDCRIEGGLFYNCADGVVVDGAVGANGRAIHAEGLILKYLEAYVLDPAGQFGQGSGSAITINEGLFIVLDHCQGQNMGPGASGLVFNPPSGHQVTLVEDIGCYWQAGQNAACIRANGIVTDYRKIGGWIGNANHSNVMPLDWNSAYTVDIDCKYEPNNTAWATGNMYAARGRCRIVPYNVDGVPSYNSSSVYVQSS